MEEDDDIDLAVAAVTMMVDDDSNSSDEGGPEEVIGVDIEGFRVMSNASFKANFRMDRNVFAKLVVVCGRQMVLSGRLKRLRTPLDLSIMMGLWPLFNPDTFRSTALHFGKKRAVIWFHYRRLILTLSELAYKFIKWPDQLERERIKGRFEEKHGYIGAVGCIDGVLIEITAPLENADGYVDRHHRHSMLVEAVCDDNLLYLDVSAGNPGAIGDIRNFEMSDLHLNLLTNPDMCEGEHLLGDSAYPLCREIMIPYEDHGNVYDWMRTHNMLLSGARVRVQNSFALLRGRERRLNKLPMRNAELVPVHIMASYVVHNFILLDGNEAEGLPPRIPRPIPDEEYQQLKQASAEMGAIKREFIANMLHPHG